MLKNTLFEHIDKTTLTLTLDSQFSNLLNDSTHSNIRKILQKHLGKLALVINPGKPSAQTLAQKQTKIHNEKTAKIQTQFLNNKAVQTLEKVFNTKIAAHSIKEINHV